MRQLRWRHWADETTCVWATWRSLRVYIMTLRRLVVVHLSSRLLATVLCGVPVFAVAESTDHRLPRPNQVMQTQTSCTM